MLLSKKTTTGKPGDSMKSSLPAVRGYTAHLTNIGGTASAH
jgi:hypothetical protein